MTTYVSSYEGVPLEYSTLEFIGTCLFAVAIVHTFTAAKFNKIAHRYPTGSIGENVFHLLGEVEVVFGFWAGILLIVMIGMFDAHHAIAFLEGKDQVLDGKLQRGATFTEPVFVFVIMAMAATRPIIQASSDAITGISKLLPMGEHRSFFIVALILGPLLGSFITEPAAMTVTALILKKRFYDRGMTSKFMYATIGVLFVNVSIGGTLSHFAAPPVVMVAEPWNFGFGYMMGAFGWKAAVAVFINTIAVGMLFSKELSDFDKKPAVGDADGDGMDRAPVWLIMIHVLFIAGVVYTNHHMVAFLGLFLFFLGICEVTAEYQSRIALKESLLVGFFLAGLVVLGTFQGWWLQDVITSMGEGPLFIGATGLTALTDNAALTYLGTQADISLCTSQGEYLAVGLKWALVGGAVAGGGLTVIANAPNPAGYGILKGNFGPGGISPLGLLAGSIAPTLVAMACLWFLPSLVETPEPKKSCATYKAEQVSKSKAKAADKKHKDPAVKPKAPAAKSQAKPKASVKPATKPAAPVAQPKAPAKPAAPAVKPKAPTKPAASAKPAAPAVKPKAPAKPAAPAVKPKAPTGKKAPGKKQGALIRTPDPILERVWAYG